MNNPKAINQKLNARRMFPKIFSAAGNVNFRFTDTPSLPDFTKAFTRELRKLKFTSEELRPDENLLLVEHTFMIQVISAEANLEETIAALRKKMRIKGLVLVGFVIQLGKELRWQRVQISEKWLKAQNDAEYPGEMR